MNKNLTGKCSVSSVPSMGSSPIPRISVIVPVYKVEKYLPECIDSILAQTFTDFELILVDDGSPDNSGKICDDYATRDSRIRVFHKENGGVSSARNLGIDNATGEWMTFIDSDDWVISQEWEKALFALSMDRNCELLLSTMCGRESGEIRTLEFGDWLYSGGWERLSMPLAFFRTHIIKRNQIRFPLGVRYGEDRLFCFKYLYFCSRIFCLGISYYNYRQREDSSMHTIRIRADEFMRNHMYITSDLMDYRKGMKPNALLSSKIISFVMPILYNSNIPCSLSDRDICRWIRNLNFSKEEVREIPIPRRVLIWLSSISLIFSRVYYGIFRIMKKNF